MNLTLEFDEETGRRLRQQAELCGQTPEAYARWAIEKFLPGPLPTHQMPLDVWLKEFKAWVESHKPLSHEVDDDRESIYAGRGE